MKEEKMKALVTALSDIKRNVYHNDQHICSIRNLFEITLFAITDTYRIKKAQQDYDTHR